MYQNKKMSSSVSIIFLSLALVIVRAQFSIDNFPIDANTSQYESTPSVVTIPETNSSTVGPSQFSTSFPLWTDTTASPNGSTSSSTPTPTHGPTSHSPSTTTNRTTTTTTTTEPSPTLPPQPKTPPEPWNVTYGMSHGNYCIMALFAAQVDITYQDTDNRELQTGLNIPTDAIVDLNASNCEPQHEQQVLVLLFNTTTVGNLKLTFQRKANESIIEQVEMSVRITENLFPGIASFYRDKTVLLSASNLSLFDTESKHSYLCKATVKINLNSIQVKDNDSENIISVNNSSIKSGLLETSSLQVQSFMPSDNNVNTFYPANECKQDKSDFSSVVPITVGLILLVMVVVVFILYFIGRSRQKNYSTM